MVLLVAGCELRSEINKCVDAKLTAIVNQECMAINQGKNEKAESTHGLRFLGCCVSMKWR